MATATQNQIADISVWDVTVLTGLLKMSTVESKIDFDSHAPANDEITRLVREFLTKAETLETELGLPILVFADGVNKAYNIKVSMRAFIAAPLCDLNAKLDASKPESLRANRELLTHNPTYLSMVADAKKGREFNDIIVEYDTNYETDRPLKVWGGQHRISAITQAVNKSNRYHGFRIYFNLSVSQRSDLALVSNTNMNVSKDTRDRIIEETRYGNKLRDWARNIELLGPSDDFPDSRGTAGEKITVKRARSFIVNFYEANDVGAKLNAEQLDQTVYEPYLARSGVVDPKYDAIMKERDITKDSALLEAGQAFAVLHHQQIAAAIKDPKLAAKAAYRNKALIESVLCGWSYIAGLLQSHPDRLKNHYEVPQVAPKRNITDPLNAYEMSTYKHRDLDPPTYRGLGTRTDLKDRQRLAQLFLAKSLKPDVVLNRSLMDQAVSQVVALQALAKGYATK